MSREGTKLYLEILFDDASRIYEQVGRDANFDGWLAVHLQLENVLERIIFAIEAVS